MAGSKSQLRYYFLPYVFVMILTACQEAISHEAGLARTRAVEFAQVVSVRQDKEIPNHVTPDFASSDDSDKSGKLCREIFLKQ